MSTKPNANPDAHSVGACRCGQNHTAPELQALAQGADDAEKAMSAGIDHAVFAGMFPDPEMRRNFFRAVGAGTALSALSSLIPLDSLRAFAQETRTQGAIEKKTLNVGFLPITCATPLIYGEQLGLFARQGLDVKLQKVAGIALIRDKMLNGELDFSQQVMPVALTMTAGLGSTPVPTRVLTILNQHGNSLVLAMKHKDNRNPKNWKGFKFAIPFDTSHQALQLRYYLAENGLDPDKDVSFRVVPPSEYVSNLRTGNVDGFFGGEPGGQRAVYEGAGFIHLLSRDIWKGHPCCSVTATEAFIKQNPNTFLAFYRGVIGASLHVSDPKNRAGMAKVLAQPNYLNQPETVVDQVITGKYADGLGNIKDVPDRVDFQPYPHYSMAVWMLTQLRRWNMIKQDIDYKKLAEQVMLATDARRLMAELGAAAPAPGYRKETILGRDFDSNRPDEYLKRQLPKA
jgi:nitrate/nitrite transport system substrate-binding protein